MATDDIQQMRHDIQQAQLGGAHRIELCAEMTMDGLTPSVDACQVARESFSKPGLLRMIRPSAGNFVFSQQEIEQCLLAIEQAKSIGLDGVVIGALDEHNQIEASSVADMVNLAKDLGLSVTFHRAFDAIADRQTAWNKLHNLRLDRVLSCGTPWQSRLTALEGLQQLIALSQSELDMELVVAGGVHAGNAQQILSALPRTQPVSLHSYSGVMTKGRVDKKKVGKIVDICRQMSQ